MIRNGVLVEIVVPRPLISMLCSNEVKKKTPEELASVLRIIYSASPSQFKIRNREVNRSFKRAVDEWNRQHPDEKVNYQKIVQDAVSQSNYAGSFIGDEGSQDEGKTFYEFKDIAFEPFFQNSNRRRLYIKFIEPEEGKDIDVVSLHRNKEN